MKKILILIISTIMCLFEVCFTGCGGGCNGCSGCSGCAENTVQFGYFTQKGKMLSQYATRGISAEEAKQISPNYSGVTVYNNSSLEKTILSNYEPEKLFTELNKYDCKPSEAQINNILSQYSECQITTNFIAPDSNDFEAKTDVLTGADFNDILEKNSFMPSNQLVAKNIIAFQGLIEYMEQENKDFKSSSDAISSPFKDIYSYHTDSRGNLVIHTKDFAEIASSKTGGVGSSYRQETEAVYDAEGKIIIWQSSLGLMVSTPKGTTTEGYILKVEFNWHLKV